MPSSDPATRVLVARIAAHEKWARCSDPAAATAAARRAFTDRFEQLVDPEGQLDPAERTRRAGHARRAHYQRLALKSAQARRKVQTLSAEADAADAELAAGGAGDAA